MRRWNKIGLRARLTLIATAALAVGLAAGSLLLLRGFASSRLHAIDSSTRDTASNIRELVTAGALPPTLPVQAGQSAQVLTATGSVLAVSPGTSHTLPLISAARATAIAAHGPRSVSVAEVAASGPNRVRVAAARLDGRPAYIVVAQSLQDERATLHSLGRFVAVAAPVLLLIVGITVWWLLGRALHTVAELRRGAEAITDPAGGIRLPLPDGRDEIHALAVTLNAMLDRLDSSAVRERQFVADVAHELRSPLAALHTQLEVALEHPPGPVRDELLAGTLADTERLAELVDDLLVLARIDAGPATGTALVDIAELAGASEARPRFVVGDRRSLARAIDNLVANAHRHARSQVRVSLASQAGVVEVLVDDDGPGVPPADRDRVFERFVRLDDARARDEGGSGLGLPIARAIAQAHGGGITVRESPLGGARFVLSLPEAKSASAETGRAELRR